MMPGVAVAAAACPRRATGGRPPPPPAPPRRARAAAPGGAGRPVRATKMSKEDGSYALGLDHALFPTPSSITWRLNW